MDKISKLRRKPKPPTIETSVERHAPADPPYEIEDTGPEPDGRAVQRAPMMPSRLSPFRRLRGSAKRARSASPATGQPVHGGAAVVGKDGMPSASRGASRRVPKMPYFLKSSNHENVIKFQDIQFDEQERTQEGMRSGGGDSAMWTLHKQTNAHDKGLMDRYPNIRPWNHNRVRLRVPPGEFEYVNASTIELFSSDSSQLPLQYIAMQGPTAPSFDYVWRMIAEQTSPPAVIVQLTTMTEGISEKCGQYFPPTLEEPTWSLNADNKWGDDWAATLTFDSLEELADGAIEKRKLLLHVEGEAEPRVVWHFLYLRWPDFGTPSLADMDSFFELMKLSREHNNTSSPRIIHCSAGVGRTGTFICLEHLMRELEIGAFSHLDADDEDLDLIYSTVDTLRQQRRVMVQSWEQYKFIYTVMRKFWQEKYGEVDTGLRNGEPASKRLEVSDPFVESNGGSSPGSDAGSAKR